MLLVTEQSETIKKANLLIVSSCRKGFYGSVVIKIEDGIIVRLVHERSIKEPFDIDFKEKNVLKNEVMNV